MIVAQPHAAARASAVVPLISIACIDFDQPCSDCTDPDFAGAVIGKGEQEALGQRIIEMPEVFEHFESRDTHARFIAYVPPGSIEKGRALAATGGGKTVQCASCHGPELKGAGAIPGLAGRSPTYLFRQLYDFKHGARKGTESPQMKPTVENLAIEDMIALAAYVASLSP